MSEQNSSVDKELVPGLTGRCEVLVREHNVATVVAIAELERIDGRWLYFKVEAFDGDRTIGVGTHRRAIITLPPEATNRGGGSDSHTHEL